MEVTQLRRSTALELPRTNFPQLLQELFYPFPNSTTCRSGTLSFLNFSFILPVSCYRQPFFHPSLFRSILLCSRPASFPTIGISTLLTDAISHHCCRLHSYIRINDCTSIPVFPRATTSKLPLQRIQTRNLCGYFSVSLYTIQMFLYVSNVPLRPHILPYIGAGAQYLIPQNSHSYCSQCSSSFGTGPHLVPTGKITFCPTRSKYLSSCNSKFVDT